MEGISISMEAHSSSDSISNLPLAQNVYYLEQQGIRISRAQFEQNLIEKASSPHFVNDIRSLLSPEIEPQWSLEEGLAMVQNRLFPYFPGIVD